MQSIITYTSIQICAVLQMVWWMIFTGSLRDEILKSKKKTPKKPHQNLVICVFGLFVSDRASITFHGNQERGPVALCLCPLPHKTWQTDLPPQWVWDTLSHPPSLHSLSTLKGQEITLLSKWKRTNWGQEKRRRRSLVSLLFYLCVKIGVCVCVCVHLHMVVLF